MQNILRWNGSQYIITLVSGHLNLYSAISKQGENLPK